ncbi:MAG: phosphate transport system regulatory protein PhoU, partial [Lachnospiraceae bacterium]|nr:phosphate transport system regulatory protein PhoU [Lachnospiraceae bacterium]
MGTRKGYDLELKEINDRVETMGKQVLLAIDRTIIALEKMDVVAANAIMKNDALIDAMETDIEERCIQIVVKEQPIASDWRRLASYMRMISDLER